MSNLKTTNPNRTVPKSPEEVLLYYLDRVKVLFGHDAQSKSSQFRSARDQILQDFLTYNDTLRKLLEGAPFLSSDLEALCRHFACPLKAEIVDALSNLGVSLEKRVPEAWWETFDNRPGTLSSLAQEIVRRPILTATDYALFNSFTLPSKERFLNIATLFDPRNPEYFRYSVIRDLRSVLSNVYYVMANLGTADIETRAKDWFFQVFQEQGPLLETAIFRKMSLAMLLRKNQLGFQHANRSCDERFEKLLARIEPTIGPSGVPLFKQIRTVFACEYWSGVASLDLIVKRLGLLRPDLQEELKRTFVEWKNYVFEMQNLQSKIRELISTKTKDIVLSSDIFEEFLISVGIFTDFIGAMELTRDILRQIQKTSFSVRFLAQIMSFLINTLLPGIRKYECLGQGEYNNIEKLIQQRTLDLAVGFQLILKQAEVGGLPEEVFRGVVYVYYELLILVFREKTRTHLKSSEKEILADSPLTPNRLYLFEKRVPLANSPSRSWLQPSVKAWEPFLRRYSLGSEGVLILVSSEKAAILAPLEKLIQGNL